MNVDFVNRWKFSWIAHTLINEIVWDLWDDSVSDHVEDFVAKIQRSIPFCSCSNCGECGDYPLYRTTHHTYGPRIEKLCEECVTYLIATRWQLEIIGTPARVYA
jgi:hypothetical protein